MNFCSVTISDNDPIRATRRASDKINQWLGDHPAWACVFVSGWLEDNTLSQVAAAACQSLGTDQIIGCRAEGIVGTGYEIERESGVSIWASRLPAVAPPMSLKWLQTADGPACVGFPDAIWEAPVDQQLLILLADPFTFPADRLLDRLNAERPGLRILGGMASGMTLPGGNSLISGHQAFHHGAVAMWLGPAICEGMKTIVSQGCRPIGQPMIVTGSENNIVSSLGGRPALERLREIWDISPNHEKELIRTALHLGRVVDEYREQFQAGDFLVRSILGVDDETLALVAGDRFRVGQTVQFHVRDAETADADFRYLLNQACGGETKPTGGLVFTCNGRGTRLFDQPNHDATAIRDAFGEIPISGIFAQGEIGPVADKNFLHGFTASCGFFYT